MSKDAIEVIFSFDTTGSMYPCLTQVRREVKATVKRLFKDVPDIRVGVIAHGDYCDAGSTYVTKKFDFSTNQDKIASFISDVSPTGGGDAAECYELVLHEARTFSWSAGKKKVLVLIGDDVPHGKNEAQNTKKLDWRNELKLLLEAGIQVYGVQALNRKHATKFYEDIAEETGGFHLELDQFSSITDMIFAVAYKQQGDEKLKEFEEELKADGRLNRSMRRSFNRMLGRKEDTSAKANLDAVPPGRFQMMKVDDDTPIAEFVRAQGVEFKTGRGFYEFTKSVKVQHYKEVILQEKATGDFYSGEKAREIAGMPIGEDATVKPGDLGGYRCFIQSTSNNRKLLGGTRFLYEVADY
jgi:von Willebrand factor type A domain